MGQHDFDKQFSQLKSRELKPSAGSWDKLSGKLETVEKRSGTRTWWLGIAASLVTGLIIGGLIFSEGDLSTTDPQVVENPAPSQPIERNIPESSSEEAVAVQESEEPIKEEGTEIKKRQNNIAIQQDQNDNMIALAEDEKEEADPDSYNITEEAGQESEAFQEAEIQIAAMTSGEISREVTDEEIAHLLRNATLELSAENSAEIAGKISAEDLLQDVENELEQSFRRKVLEMLQDGFSKARTAVANRNH